MADGEENTATEEKKNPIAGAFNECVDNFNTAKGGFDLLKLLLSDEPANSDKFKELPQNTKDLITSIASMATGSSNVTDMIDKELNGHPESITEEQKLLLEEVGLTYIPFDDTKGADNSGATTNLQVMLAEWRKKPDIIMDFITSMDEKKLGEFRNKNPELFQTIIDAAKSEIKGMNVSSAIAMLGGDASNLDDELKNQKLMGIDYTDASQISDDDVIKLLASLPAGIVQGTLDQINEATGQNLTIADGADYAAKLKVLNAALDGAVASINPDKLTVLQALESYGTADETIAALASRNTVLGRTEERVRDSLSGTFMKDFDFSDKTLNREALLDVLAGLSADFDKTLDAIETQAKLPNNKRIVRPSDWTYDSKRSILQDTVDAAIKQHSLGDTFTRASAGFSLFGLKGVYPSLRDGAAQERNIALKSITDPKGRKRTIMNEIRKGVSDSINGAPDMLENEIKGMKPAELKAMIEKNKGIISDSITKPENWIQLMRVVDSDFVKKNADAFMSTMMPEINEKAINGIRDFMNQNPWLREILTTLMGVVEQCMGFAKDTCASFGIDLDKPKTP